MFSLFLHHTHPPKTPPQTKPSQHHTQQKKPTNTEEERTLFIIYVQAQSHIVTTNCNFSALSTVTQFSPPSQRGEGSNTQQYAMRCILCGPGSLKRGRNWFNHQVEYMRTPVQMAVVSQQVIKLVQSCLGKDFFMFNLVFQVTGK